MSSSAMDVDTPHSSTGYYPDEISQASMGAENSTSAVKLESLNQSTALQLPPTPFATPKFRWLEAGEQNMNGFLAGGSAPDYSEQQIAEINQMWYHYQNAASPSPGYVDSEAAPMISTVFAEGSGIVDTHNRATWPVYDAQARTWVNLAQWEVGQDWEQHGPYAGANSQPSNPFIIASPSGGNPREALAQRILDRRVSSYVCPFSGQRDAHLATPYDPAIAGASEAVQRASDITQGQGQAIAPMAADQQLPPSISKKRARRSATQDSDSGNEPPVKTMRITVEVDVRPRHRRS